MTLTTFTATFGLKSITLCKISPWILHEHVTPKLTLSLLFFCCGIILYTMTPFILDYVSILTQNLLNYGSILTLGNKYSHTVVEYITGMLSEVVGIW